jgi:hypothetical protein
VGQCMLWAVALSCSYNIVCRVEQEGAAVNDAISLVDVYGSSGLMNI